MGTKENDDESEPFEARISMENHGPTFAQQTRVIELDDGTLYVWNGHNFDIEKYNAERYRAYFRKKHTITNHTYQEDCESFTWQGWHFTKSEIKAKKTKEKKMAKSATKLSKDDEDEIKPVVTDEKIEFPVGMTYENMRKYIDRKESEEENSSDFHEVIDGFAHDALAALMRVLKRKYGWTDAVPVDMGFWGIKKPTMVSVEVSKGKTIQCPVGRIMIPGVEGHLDLQLARTQQGLISMAIAGSVKGKHKKHIIEIAEETRKEVREHSIYRGKAIKINLADEKLAPKFVDLANITLEDLILPMDVMGAIRTALFTPIRKTDRTREWKIPLKRGILLSGPFGTGKSLTANVTAKLCEENGWTFIYLEDVRQLPGGLAVARHYAKSVLFAEDIDRTTCGDRNADMDAILNTLDGVDGKDAEVISVFTTNNCEAINPAMHRPGRIDAIIDVKPPDEYAARLLMERYSRGLAKAGTDFTKAAKIVEGFVPAVIREVVERAKLAAIDRDADHITGGDMAIAAAAVKNQVDLLNRKYNPHAAGMSVAALVGHALLGRNGNGGENGEDGCDDPNCPIHGKKW